MPRVSMIKWLLLCMAAVGLCLVSGSVGALISAHLGKSQYTISYSDFITIILTAISVLLTILAIIIALVGVVSWTTISERVKQSTESYLSDGFSEGKHLFVMLQQKSQAASYRGVQPIGDVDEAEAAEYNEEGDQ